MNKEWNEEVLDWMQASRCEMMEVCTQVLEMMYEKILEDEFKNS